VFVDTCIVGVGTCVTGAAQAVNVKTISRNSFVYFTSISINSQNNINWILTY
jgi:hypothetical protein